MKDAMKDASVSSPITLPRALFMLSWMTLMSGVRANTNGMTWGTVNDPSIPPGVSLAACHGAPALTGPEVRDGACNAYVGDTACTTKLPVLCFQQEGISQPAGITPNFYQGWSGGRVNLTPPIAGFSLRSRAMADGLCQLNFGPNAQMAEFHNGGGGWGFYANGTLGNNSRYWVAINDQPANCWDNLPLTTSTVTDTPTLSPTDSTKSITPSSESSITPSSTLTSEISPSPTSTPSATPTSTVSPLSTQPPTSIPVAQVAEANAGKGLTWGVVKNAKTPDDITLVSCHGEPRSNSPAQDGACDAYLGDTSCNEELPVLCVEKDGSVQPAGLTDVGFYKGWVKGKLGLTPAIAGIQLTKATGDALCAKTFGNNAHMGEFHEGGGGWGFYGKGQIDSNSRFWVAINDQHANCWNSVRSTQQPVKAITSPSPTLNVINVSPSSVAPVDSRVTDVSPGNDGALTKPDADKQPININVSQTNEASPKDSGIKLDSAPGISIMAASTVAAALAAAYVTKRIYTQPSSPPAQQNTSDQVNIQMPALDAKPYRHLPQFSVNRGRAI